MKTPIEWAWEVISEIVLWTTDHWRFLTWVALAFGLSGVSLMIAGAATGSRALLLVGAACILLGVGLGLLDCYFEKRGE